MNRKLQVYVMLSLAVVLAASVIWDTSSSWQRLRTWRRSVELLTSESFDLADHIEARTLELDQAVTRFDPARRSIGMGSFKKSTEELQSWLRSKQAIASTSRQRRLLREIDNAIEEYSEKICSLMTPPTESEAVTGIDAIRKGAGGEHGRVLALAVQLQSAEREAMDGFVNGSSRLLKDLEGQLMLSVLLALLLGLAAGGLVYLAKIAPLSAQLTESRSMVERQEKLAALGTLAAGIAHEIRNPLLAMKARLHGLNRAIRPNSPEHENAAVIGQEIKRLERIVSDFLEFARPAEPRMQWMEASALLTQVTVLLAGHLGQAGIELEVDCPSGLRLRVDPQQIEQVLINLVQNAADSIGTNGSIVLRCRTDSAVFAGKTLPVSVLEISDTGAGIAPEVEKRLFDPFFTTKRCGTGLGLPIAACIVEKHGGLLQYKTNLGSGTTFSVVLPSAGTASMPNSEVS
jgi:signal transduction histidine kinase